MVTEKYLSPKDIAVQFSVSKETARRWIMQILGDDVKLAPTKKGRGKRPYRLRRVAQSLLEKHLDELING
jgi:predicted ArsR family transcriptional regulator